MSTLNLSKRELPYKTNNSTFFNIRLPNIGSITYLIYDLISLIKSLKYIKKNRLNKSSIFLLSTRIGIFLPFFVQQFKKYNVSLYVYVERNDKNIWTPLVKNLWQKSEYICTQYAKSVILTNQDFEKCFPNSKELSSKIVNLNCDLSTFDISFDSFLKKFDIHLHDYYFMIDSCKIFSRTNLVIDQFSNCNTTKKLVILSKKRSLSYKHSIINSDFFKDNRIICLNIKRFVHLIPHLSKYCHGIIHSDMIATKNDYIENNNLNLVLESSYNLRLNIPNTLYFNEKSFLDTIKKADNIQKKCVRLQDSNNDIMELIDTLEYTLTK